MNGPKTVIGIDPGLYGGFAVIRRHGQGGDLVEVRDTPRLCPTCRASDCKGPASTERYLSKGRNPMTERLSAAVQACGERRTRTLDVEQTVKRHT